MKIGVMPRGGRGRFRQVALALALVAGLAVTPVALVLGSSPAGAATTTYTPSTPTLATLTSPSGCSGSACAPWDEYQGDPGTASGVTDTGGTSYGQSNLLPTYTPGGPTTTTSNGYSTSTCTGGSAGSSVTEPNLSVVPSACSTLAGVASYPSGVVGTPGPLDGYCGSGTNTQEAAGTAARQPAGAKLPLAPSYFPHIVRDSDGDLTGYFDYRPKDADEALMAATSTDNGKDWTYDGEALEQNPDLCATGDVNDDGQGHDNLIQVGGQWFLYTLERAAGDNQGVGMIIHPFSPSEATPLSGLPSSDPTGIDPDAFVTGSSSVSVATSGGATIPLTNTGSADSPEQLIVGSFVDYTQAEAAPGVTPDVITCTSVSVTSIGGCSATTAITINPSDLIEQVMGFTSSSSTIDAGSTQNTIGGGGTSSVTLDATSGGSSGFTDPLTGLQFNTNAPNRIDVAGHAIYCAQANANPTTKIEDCSTGENNASLSVPSKAAVYGDPIIPASAYAPTLTEGGTPVTENGASGEYGMTNGLVAPDGIVGVLPSYPGAPVGSTVVMYTEKELQYFVAADLTSASPTFSTSSFSLATTSTPQPYISADLPNAAGPDTLEVGATCSGSACAGGSGATAIVPVTCSTVNETTGAFTGCTVPAQYAGSNNVWTAASNTYVGAPGATTETAATLAKTGEGSTSAAKLYKNNEDLSVLRVAYTTDGVNFSTAGLTNGGVISDCVNSTGVPNTSADTSCTSPYTGLTNPSSTTDPSGGLNAYATNEGTPGVSDGTDIGSTSGGDLTEMRWIGSAGSIITNPDGSYGLFLSAAWSADGDSDAFNQVFYSHSTNGESWSVPTPVISTDYSFADSYNQDNNVTINGVAQGSQPLGISAYYEGRAYGPSVVQDPNGTLTMVFSGYRFPKSITAAGTVLGIDSPQWTVGADDATMFRNILTTTLSESTSPAVSTTTTMTTAPTSPAVVGQTESVSATVAPASPGTGTPTGTVTFSGGAGTLCTGTLNESTPDTASCTYTYEGPLSSPDSVTASYDSDSNYATSASPATPVTVNQDATTTSTPSASNGGSPANPAVVGEPLTLASTVTVTAPGSGTPTGSVSFSDGGSSPLCTATLSDGSDVASCTYTPTAANAGDAITAAYGGDANDDASTSTALTEVVDAAATTTAMTITPTTPLVGQLVTFSATVTPNAPGGGTPTGTVTFGDGGGTLCAAPLSGNPSTASCTTMDAGVTSDSITATYPGTADFTASSANSTVSIAQAMTATVVGPDDATPVVGEQVTYTATVSVTAPGSGTPTGTVDFTGDGGALCTGVPVAATGTATCTQTYASTGSDSVSAAYSGDTNFAASGSSTSVVIGQDATTTTVTVSPSPAVVGQPVTVSATVAPVAPGTATPTGSVSFSDGGGTCTGTLSGTAPYTASCSTTYPSPISGDTVTGIYSGDSSDAGSTGTTPETVNQDGTTTTLTSSPSAPIAGQKVTYTASVGVSAPGVGTPTGTVVFTGSGGAIYCASDLSGSDPATATCSKTYAGAGGDTVSAAYGGDANDRASTGTETPTVGQDATTTSVTSSPGSPVVGQSVTLTATVSVTSPGSGTPTGTVDFSGNGGTACSGTLSGTSTDTASCTATYPGATSGTVTASYGGDTNDASSSGTTSVSVGQAATTTSVTSNPPTPVAGQSITLTATVAAESPGAGIPTGSVTFTSGGTLCEATLSGTSPDTASCSATFNGGASGTVTGTYAGDTNFNGSSGTTSLSVGKGSSTTAVTSSATPGVTGEPLIFTATVSAVAPATGTPAGTVTFAFGDPVPTKGPGHLATPSCGGVGPSGDGVTLSGGTATCTIPGLLVEQSPLAVTAQYSGSSGFSASTSPSFIETIGKAASTVTVTAKANPTVTSKAASFSAIVAAAAPGAGDPTGTATWSIASAGGTVIPCKASNTTVNKKTGKTTCSVATQELFAADGPYTVSVSYSGDANFAASTGTFTQNIAQTASKTLVTVVRPATSGGPASITATVKGVPASAGTPTGTVTFALTSATGTAVDCDTSNTSTLSAGVATCTVTAALVFAGSPYSVVATYSGDANFTASTSTAKPIRVPK